MQSTTTDRWVKQQSNIDQRRKQAATSYAERLAGLAREWNSPGTEDRAWLVYSANYVLRTGGLLWALDPLTLGWRVPGAPVIDAGLAFGKLKLILLTHAHGDHLDYDLLKAMRHLPIQWVIPDFILPEVQDRAGLPGGQIITPRPLQPIEVCGLGILPFEGLHWEERTDGGRRHGVPAMGYAVGYNGKRWLFPGDTRNYQPEGIPSQGRVDVMFAHVWLGRGCALMERPPLVEAFCRFCAYPEPKKLVLTHLEELGRGAEDFWEERHARMVIERLGEMRPEIPVSVARMGDSTGV
jgi:hypothetical protein